MTGTIDLPGYGRLKQRTMTKEQLAHVWDDILDTTRMPVETGVRVDGLRADGDAWVVSAGERTWRAANVILAIGRRGSPRRLGVSGEDQAHVHYRLLEPDPFAGKHVLVVGGGNAAAECALALADAGKCAGVALSYRRAQLARLRGAVRQRIESAFASGRVTPLLATEVVSIGHADVTLRRAAGEVDRRRADAVIVQIGGTPPGDLLARLGIDMVTKRGEA
jgi:thioredoxin reductase